MLVKGTLKYEDFSLWACSDGHSRTEDRTNADNTTPNGATLLHQVGTSLAKHEENNKKEGKLLLPCRLKKKQEGYLWALVDTCSQVTILHLKYVNRSKLRPTSVAMVAANNLEIPIVGKMQIRLIIGSLKLTTTVYVTSHLIEDLLIGMDVLWKNEADIFCSKKKFKIGPKENRQTFLIVSQDNITKIQSNARAAVKVKEDVILHPREMLAVEVIEEETIRKNRRFLEQTGLEAECVQKGPDSYVFIDNNTGSSKRIKKNQTEKPLY